MNNISKSNILILFFWIFLIFLFLNEFFSKSYSNDNNNDNTYDADNFENTKIKIYNFNTTWCGHSKNFQPIWDMFSESLTNEDNIITYDVKCDDNINEKLSERYYIDGYPTIIIDYGDKFIKYSGPRTVNGLRSILNLKPLNEPENINDQIISNVKCGNKIDTRPAKVVNFDDYSNNSNNFVEKNNTIIYNFNTSWCGYSLKFQPTWDEFSEANKDSNVKIVDVKCDKKENELLCNLYPVDGFPTVLKVKGNVVIPYNGQRTLDGLQNFLNN